MAKALPVLHAFSAGEASDAALARVDQETIRLTAERQENLLPYVVGKAIMRPGTQYIGQAYTTPATGDVMILPFVRSATETALIELSRSGAQTYMRTYIDDVLVTYPSVSCSVPNGDFSGGSTGWTDASTGGGALTFGGAYCAMQAIASGGRAVLKKHFTTASVGVLHAIQIRTDGSQSITFRCGSTDSGFDYIGLSVFPPGFHSLAFTPTAADIYIEFETTSKVAVYVNNVAIAPAGAMLIPSVIDSDQDWTTLKLSDLRYTQSLDVIYLSLAGARQMMIQHRGPYSWSWALYYSDDGPFEVAQSRPDITLTPSATRGAATLTSNADFFDSSMVGSLFQITHAKMKATFNLGAGGVSTPAFRVTGIQTAGDRAWSATVTGTWTGTIVVERSFDDQFSGFNTYGVGARGVGFITTNGTVAISDSDDNAITWYRLTFSGYTSGSATIQITYGGYGYTGVARVFSISSPTTANIEILSDLANISPSNVWLQGDWGVANGYPTAVALFDGRLWWARDDRFWGSVSDAYNSMAAAMPASTTTSGTSVTGDSSSIQRQIATGGGANDVVYMLPLQRLIFGTSNVEASARSSSLDEPLTPTNITLKEASSQGGYPAPAIKVDKRGIFIQRSSHKLYELSYDAYGQDYNAQNLMRINEDIGYPEDPAYSTGFTQIAVQRQPETYIWGVRSDGICCCLLFEPSEKVQGWFRVTTGQNEFASGAGNDKIVSVAVLPTQGEDIVYFVTRRLSGGFDSYYIERLQSHRNTLTRVFDTSTYKQVTAPGVYQVDCHKVATPSGLVVSGLSYLEGRVVMALGFSTARQSYGPLLNAGGGNTFTVSGGAITLGEAATGNVTVGLPYAGYYKSSKLAYGAPQGSTALLQPKKVDAAGLLLLDTHPDALLIGSDFDGIESMDPLPRIEDLKPVQTTGALERVYDKRMFPISNVWDTDARICLKVNPGYSATLSGIVLAIETSTE